MTNPQPESNEEKPKYQSFVTGLVVASIPIAGYLVAFAYEKGVADYFRIPDQLITLDWTTMFIAAGAVLGTLVAVVLMFELLSRIVQQLPLRATIRSFLNELLERVSIQIFLLPAVVWASSLSTWIFLTFFVLFAVWVFVGSVLPLTTRLLKKRTPNEKLQAQEASASGPIRQTPVGLVLRHRYGRGLLVLVAVVIYLAIASYSLGHLSAKRQTEFFMVESPQELVVLRAYHDHLICAPFNRESREIDGSQVIVIKAASDTGVVLSRERVGPLKVKEQ